MNILDLIQLISLGVVALFLIVYLIVAAVKNKWVRQLIQTIEKAISEAEEKFNNGEGELKKEYVLKAVESKAQELGIPYRLLYKLISKLIDKIISDYNVIAKK